jgi:hypothetical protein
MTLSRSVGAPLKWARIFFRVPGIPCSSAFPTSWQTSSLLEDSIIMQRIQRRVLNDRRPRGLACTLVKLYSPPRHVKKDARQGQITFVESHLNLFIFISVLYRLLVNIDCNADATAPNWFRHQLMGQTQPVSTWFSRVDDSLALLYSATALRLLHATANPTLHE